MDGLPHASTSKGSLRENENKLLTDSKFKLKKAEIKEHVGLHLQLSSGKLEMDQ